MDDPGRRTHRAGQSIVNLCRACKAERDHTVIAVGGDGRAARVQCDFCGSQHNYRGGGGPTLADVAFMAGHRTGGEVGDPSEETCSRGSRQELRFRRR